MITKRIFLAALTCDTAGWYAARAQADPPGPGMQWRFYAGAEIGRLAREQLGRGTLLPFAPTDVALRATATAMNDQDSTLLFRGHVGGRAVRRACRRAAPERPGVGRDRGQVGGGTRQRPGQGQVIRRRPGVHGIRGPGVWRRRHAMHAPLSRSRLPARCADLHEGGCHRPGGAAGRGVCGSIGSNRRGMHRR